MSEPRKEKRHEPVGPFAPPLPSEADQDENAPMAVAGDETTQHDSFKPTTQSADAFDRDVANRNRDPQLTAPLRGDQKSTPHGRRVEDRSDENQASERPSGYSAVDENGYVRPEGDTRERQASSAEDAASPRVNMPNAGRAGELTTDEDENVAP